MAKTASTDIFDLIKSLNASEKRYFKLYVQRHSTEECNSLKLFDYIDGLEKYDEQTLLKTFKNESFTKKFAITKARLYDNVLAALNAYHQSKSIQADLYKALNSVEILFEKALYDQCKKILRSAAKLAEKHEEYETLLQIHKWEKKLIENTSYFTSKDDLDAFVQTENEVLQKIEKRKALWALKSELFYKLNHKGVARNENEKKEIQNILAQIIHLKPKDSDAKYLYNHVKSACYFALSDFIKCAEYLEKNYTLLMERKDKVQKDPALFLSTSTNLIYVKIKIADFESAHQLLADLKRFKDIFKIEWNSDIDIKWFSSLKSIEINYRLEKRDKIALQRMIDDLDEDLKYYQNKLSPLRLSFFLFKKAEMELKLNHPQKALKTLNELLSNTKTEQRQDIYCYARILEVLAQYEQGSFTLLPYTIRSLNRLLKGKEKEFNFEITLVKQISKLSKITNPHDHNEIWSIFLDKVEKDKNQNFQTNDYFDLHAWLKAKVFGKNMLEIV